MTICDVANCPAAALDGSRFCGSHEVARTAKELRLGPDEDGNGARSCAKCRRAFKDADFVQRAPVERRVRAKVARGWQHVACAPASSRPTRKQIRESLKPLLEAGGDLPGEGSQRCP